MKILLDKKMAWHDTARFSPPDKSSPEIPNVAKLFFSADENSKFKFAQKKTNIVSYWKTAEKRRKKYNMFVITGVRYNRVDLCTKITHLN